MIRIISGAVAVLSTLAGEVVLRRKSVNFARTAKMIERIETIQHASFSLFCASFLF